MILWNFLENVDNFLYRKPKLHLGYLKHTKKIIQKYGSVHLYIKEKIIKNRKIHLSLNRFPYDIEKNVSHWIIWDLEDSSLDKYKKLVYKIFNPKYYDFIFRINKEEDRSILEIKHCHLFVKCKKIKFA